MSDNKTTLTRSGLRPEQDMEIARQYASAARPSVPTLARAWGVPPGRIRAALLATNTPIRPRGTRSVTTRACPPDRRTA